MSVRRAGIWFPPVLDLPATWIKKFSWNIFFTKKEEARNYSKNNTNKEAGTLTRSNAKKKCRFWASAPITVL
jgi:hypothetical protein